MKLLFILLAMLIQQAPDGHRVFSVGKTVMGYTDSHAVVSDSELPPALLAWMQWSGTAEAITTSDDHVDPLLWTQWNQSKPYNNNCPEYQPGKKSSTGCVATAMAQVMAYWRFPESFNWDNMLPNYATLEGQNATQTQINAVATLMQMCGQAIDMEYGESSSASLSAVPVALASRFGYNNGIRFVYRNQMNYAEWAELLRNELRNGRPVLYRGASSSTGHCFVIDGFNEQGYFHVNWGWGGKSDGWYRFTMLTPPNLGAGGGNSSDGYNYKQAMLVGVAPATILSTPIEYRIEADSLMLFKNHLGLDSAIIRGYANYNSGSPIVGHLGLALFQNGNMLRVIRYNDLNRPADGDWNRTINNFTIDSLVAGQTYQLIAVWRDPVNAPDWQIVQGINHAPCGRNLYATSANTFTHNRIDYQGYPQCITIQNNILATGHTTTISSVWTAEQEEWTGRIALALDNGTEFQFIAFSGMDLMPNRLDTLFLTSMELTVPPGQYQMRAAYYDGSSLHWLPTSLPVTVENRTKSDKLYPVPNSIVLSDTRFSSHKPMLSMDLQMALSSSVATNTLFSGTITIGIYDNDDQLLLTPATPLNVMCTKQDTIALHFEGNIGDYLPDGRYRVMIRRRPTGNSGYTFLTNDSFVNYITVDATYVSIEPFHSIHHPAHTILRDGKILIVLDNRTYDLLGRPVQ